VYLVCGEEDFLVEEAVRSLLDAAVPAEHRGFNLDVLQGAEADVRDVIARASAFPMAAERRAVVLRDAEKLGPKDLELLASYVGRPLPSTVMILTAAKPDMRRKVFATVKKAGALIECKPLGEAQLPSWIARRCKARNRAIEPEASRLLSTLVGRGLRELDQEIEKLFVFTGDRAVITGEDVAAVVGVSRQHNIFELQRAIAGGDVARAEEILNRMLEAGNGAPYFVVMLAGFFATVWRMHDLRRRGLSDDRIAAELHRERWMLADHLAALERYAPYRVEQALALLLAADERSKSGGDDAIVLQTLLVELMAEAGPR
jgi:DNA polymerase-3 subunit delta